MISLFSAGMPLAYLGILFFFIFLGSFGLPGATIWMLSSGALASDLSSLIMVMIIVAVAAILGDFAVYEITRAFTSKLLSGLARFRFYRDHEGKANELFERSAFSAIFFTRFLFMELGTVVSILAGFQRLRRRLYAAAVIPGEILYGIIYPALGYIFKNTWNDVYNVVSDVLLALGLVIIVVLVLLYLKKRKR